MKSFDPLICPAPLMLAAYIDGRASEDEAAAIELHLARCGECLQTVRDRRADMASASAGPSARMTFVPPQVLERAMALVDQPAESISSQPHRMRLSAWIVYGRRAAALAASLVIGVSGYQVGGGLSATATTTSTENAVASDVDFTFGLLDSSAFDQGETSFMSFDATETSS